MLHENAKILVLGSNGQLGTALRNISTQSTDKIFVFADRNDIDITDHKLVDFIIYHNPDFIINCAAYTAVDLAETETLVADQVNHQACQWIVEGASKTDSVVLHVSTDYVYHINPNRPLLENDKCTPAGVYATTKYLGEQVISTYPKHIILRTSWVYSNTGKNFYKTMLQLSTKKALTIVADQYGAPTYANDLADACLQIVCHIDGAKHISSNFGIYNFSNEGCITWYDFAKTIFDLHQLDLDLQKTTTKAYNAPAERPLWSVLSRQKIKKNFNLTVPHWLDGLKRCVIENSELIKSNI